MITDLLDLLNKPKNGPLSTLTDEEFTVFIWRLGCLVFNTAEAASFARHARPAGALDYLDIHITDAETERLARSYWFSMAKGASTKSFTEKWFCKSPSSLCADAIMALESSPGHVSTIGIEDGRTTKNKETPNAVRHAAITAIMSRGPKNLDDASGPVSRSEAVAAMWGVFDRLRSLEPESDWVSLCGANAETLEELRRRMTEVDDVPQNSKSDSAMRQLRKPS